MKKKEIDVIINKITDFREVNMFSVKYKSQKYKVTLKNKIRINLIKILAATLIILIIIP